MIITFCVMKTKQKSFSDIWSNLGVPTPQMFGQIWVSPDVW